jgi:hypothetical protein
LHQSGGLSVLDQINILPWLMPGRGGETSCIVDNTGFSHGLRKKCKGLSWSFAPEIERKNLKT